MIAAWARSQAEAAAAALIAALPLAWLLSLSGAVALPAALACALAVAAIVLLAGQLALRAAHAADMPVAAAWVAGMLATSLALLVLTLALQVLAATAFAIWAVLVLALSLSLPSRALAATRVRAGELLALVLCAAATLYWCRELAEVPQFLASEGVLKTWVDQFIHGGVISQFGDPRAAGQQSIMFAGVPLFAYHYASYLVPAALAWPLDLPGLTLATSLWVPAGFFTLCAGAYVLGATLAGPAGGCAALAALVLMPDPASYGLHNRLFGYYWYVLAVPTASYAVGAALLAIALLHRWAAGAGRRSLIASAVVVAALAPVRLHIFLLTLPAWLTAIVLAGPLARPRKLLALALGAAAFALFVFAFYGHLSQASPALWEFLHDLHNRQEPTAYRGVYQAMLRLYGSDAALAAGLLAIVPASLGILLVLYPLSVLAVHRSRGLAPIDVVPVVFLAWYFLLIVTVPTPAHGDATEFTQRPFVLLYAVVAIWTAAGFVPWVAAKGGLTTRRVRLALLGAAAVAVALALRYTDGDWRWAYEYRVAEGLPSAARFVRQHARAGDVLAVQGLAPTLVTTDLATQLTSMTGVASYLARPFSQIAQGGGQAQLATQRYVDLGEVAREGDAAAALERLRRLGIRWYVVAESDLSGPRWDPERRRAVFVDRMVAVYSTRGP